MAAPGTLARPRKGTFPEQEVAGIHPELEAEQAVIDHAYACLDDARTAATRLTSMVEVGQGGTEQARYEREVIYEQVLNRLSHLQLGTASLVFGRIDQAPRRHADDEPTGSTDDDGEYDPGGATYYIGRLGVWDRNQDPVVVDWRAPVAEAFYRATGREPLGLERRRHFATRGRTLLGIEDELFGDLTRLDGADGEAPRVSGQGALIAALEAARTGRLSDIVATIQGEQDAIIRAPLPGVLVCQGGPGTGKTVVALHRAAYLLYTHRFPLDGQGVLVVGPNRLFLAYIEQVLPSLGEAGVEMAVLADLISHARVEGRDSEPIARVKGDLRMVPTLAKAVRDRQRVLRADVRVGYGLRSLWLTVEQSESIVREARRRFRTHNGARKFVEQEVFASLAGGHPDDPDPNAVRERVRHTTEIREALEWMWPVLTPARLLNDLYGSRALLRSAAKGRFANEEIELLYRPRAEVPEDIVWRDADVALLDEARELLGSRPGKKQEDAWRTYGHIVVDEAQDLSPMDLRVLTRRSLNGSMTVVGDIAQSTGAWAHDSWDEVLAHLPDRRPAQLVELTVGYRIPAPMMSLAARVLTEAAPGLKPPRAVRQDGEPPRVVRATGPVTEALVELVRDELASSDAGNIAVIHPASLGDAIAAAFDDAGLSYGRANRRGLDQQLTIVPVGLVKGLEVDAAIVVEPSRIVAEEAQGMRALYVALTRATKRLRVVHADSLPAVLRE